MIAACASPWGDVPCFIGSRCDSIREGLDWGRILRSMYHPINWTIDAEHAFLFRWSLMRIAIAPKPPDTRLLSVIEKTIPRPVKGIYAHVGVGAITFADKARSPATKPRQGTEASYPPALRRERIWACTTGHDFAETSQWGCVDTETWTMCGLGLDGTYDCHSS